MRLFFVVVFLFSSFGLYAQGVNNLWVMGYQSWAGPPFGGTNMDFYGGTLNISYVSRLTNYNTTNGVICDSMGNLLFSSNGSTVFNARYDTMLNGSGLNPSFYTSMYDSVGLTLPQANLIIPMPGDLNKYYLFHLTDDDWGSTYAAKKLYYSIIDMSLDSGLGAVVVKNNVLFSDTLVPGALTACKHGNGRDWWLFCHELNSNRYYEFLITPAGISGPFSISIGSVRNIDIGQCAFSPNGNFFAYYISTCFDLDLFSFDRCTGNLYNPINVPINDSAFCGGVAFSRNSNVLYVSSQNYVYQFDLTAASIPGSELTVAVWDSFYSPNPPFASYFYLSQLAPDSKIYINYPNGLASMHVIDFPDSLGVNCHVAQHSIALPSYNAFTIPNHPNYFLGRDTGSVCDTLTAVPIVQAIEKGLTLFPNPASRLLYAHFKSSENIRQYKLTVYDVLGEKVDLPYSVIKNEYFELEISSIKTGIYILELTSDKEKIVKRFIKN